MAYRAPLQEITRQHPRFGSTVLQHSNTSATKHATTHLLYPNKESENRTKQKPKRVASSDAEASYDRSTRFVLQTNGAALGSGAYGTVYSAFDRRLNINVAVKVIKPQTENALLCPTTIREIGLLQTIKHKHIICLLDMWQEPKLSVIYLVFERAHYDLKKFWNKFYHKNALIQHAMDQAIHHHEHHGHRSTQAPVINLTLIRNIMRQILDAIAFLHSIKLLHRDIKPQNILLFVSSGNGAAECTYTIKIADFGLARSNNQPNLSLTTEVVTLWYRPIELLLGCKVYDKSVDEWAVGCVFFELITNSPLFPAMCQIETIFKIFQTLGTPTMSQWSGLQSLQHYQTRFPRFKRVAWNHKDIAFNFVGNAAIHLLNNLLQLNPEKRISAKKALQHPFLM
eukprot:CAMPEP_0202703254 /NCGR_PEP_ID=MMETSP1385-20130828/16120_1 /ASSEMBLY_ACC=CAM_ASM_000861 /TAXON_ID=933848 /ORGANISM="Elphidium margaritaceum" /LENGTH=396 /DNA_ID=CAMNT_0049361075 /DNA_START=25 /DNA_END=1215 /DNA_ORIENTATION=+